ncbi:MAG: redoxin domain-containing protein [Tannerellaceae bacterium]
MKNLKLFALAFLSLFFTNAYTAKAQRPDQGIRVGEKAPDFTLTDATGASINLYSLLEKGPVVLSWYRGGWCPYCNVALKGLADVNDDIKQLGATLVAITPEMPDKSLSTKEKNELPFVVLSDLNNEVARQYDLVFKLDDQTANRYEQSFALSTYNGNANNELPIPATYIIDQKGVIRYAYINTDYKQRANPDDVLMQLTQMVKSSNNDKLVLVWSSDNPMVAERVALMYSHAAQKSKWYGDVTLVIWGPSAKLIANNVDLQKKIQQMQKDGVRIQACVACADAYGVVETLKQLNYEVLPMGIPLTTYLKQGYNVLTF